MTGLRLFPGIYDAGFGLNSAYYVVSMVTATQSTFFIVCVFAQLC